MKTLIIIGLGLSIITARTQFSQAQQYYRSTPAFTPGPHIASGERRSASSSGSAFDNMPAPAPVLSPRDPHRTFGTNSYRLAGVDPSHGFVAFQGTVIQSFPGVVIISGTFTGCDGSIVFAVTNFPYVFGAQQRITVGDDQMFYVARLSGTYDYSGYGNQQSVRALDYGTIYVPKPKDAAELKADADKKQKDNDASTARALKANQDLADKGDEYGLLRMGERYRDGDGVDKDLIKAKDCFTKATAAGSPSAQTELEAMNK